MKSIAHQAPPYASILHGLRGLKPLQQVHTHIITLGLANNVFLANRLMNCYASSGLMAVAEQIFRRIKNKNVVSWTILISAMTKYDLHMEAFEIFCEMKKSGFLPNAVTITSILPAIGNLGLTQIGKSLHCFLLRCHLDVNVFVETSLIYMYSRFGCINAAQRLFDRMPNRNVVSWNALISGYSHNGFGEEVICLFKLMQRNGFPADFMTIMTLISGFSILGSIQAGTAIHGYTIKNGSENDKLVKTALIDMYVKCRCIGHAYRVFTEIPMKDVVTWTLMLSSFSDFGYWNKALELFNEMMRIGMVALDSVALMGILSSCSRSGALQHGRRIHALAIKTGFGEDTFVGSTLIDMYANCGDLENARNLFEGMEGRDIACWNAMISGCGMNGYGSDAIGLFLQMTGSGLEPANSTLLCVLCACSHSGIVDQGLHIFNCMVKDWSIKLNLQHYACVVDLLGRAGRLQDAHSFINNMPLQPDSEVYGALLGACRVHGNIDLGLQISQKLFELDPDEAGYYILLSNMHATAGNWEAAMTTRVSLRSKGLKKTPGLSSIEIDREIHTFMAGDRDHPQYHEIYRMLKGLITKIEAAEYVPDTNCVFQDLPDEIDKLPVSPLREASYILG
ncbi:pentatricopeptide repeat-containing protein At1g11290, chloroplastic-like [Macadamia integrifolia]|uniref:pentatricopeptide repeat-containing protein At1g11290, chloroplastic-like n=1 Tax=Macadamia integrifolia TaxID=60698 RepID=UPI001C4EC0F3|nr:pentatricopeptide repeat-containing protein At1g11290, chloroplastic-like [Macadamia integrifolia]XP_042510641.1 pentatricopeptide repeat-containing protein At1g11290, chloroplastic-like [Macadamia integrifolia]XP_042510642.1 pentatricopeptide repeat-containing protein At1g11290, chloroplastic-like [Macadamia integrifolia]XP_042510643.1 pentatricopeptide repeat-containing protein At1g11290, chloroplastic-like [Macadamia integrifolia]